jgi:hypothetical protein
MFLFNRLKRIDLILVIVVILHLAIRGNDFIEGVLVGMGATLFVFSVVGHIVHYRQTKRFY